MTEIQNVTYGFWGNELPEWMAIQRLVLAGFHDPRVLLDMFAIIEGESGSYTKAWHANIERDAGGNLVLDSQGRMTVKSVDLGFIQRNVVLRPARLVRPTEAEMAKVVNQLFTQNPELAQADTSAEIAHSLWKERGFQPWYAYKPGTESFKLKKRRGAKAIANYLLRTQVGKIDDGKYPRVDFV